MLKQAAGVVVDAQQNLAGAGGLRSGQALWQVIGHLQGDAGLGGSADGEVADFHHDRAFVNGGVGSGNFRQLLGLVQFSGLAVEFGEERELCQPMIFGHCVVEG